MSMPNEIMRHAIVERNDVLAVSRGAWRRSGWQRRPCVRSILSATRAAPFPFLPGQ